MADADQTFLVEYPVFMVASKSDTTPIPDFGLRFTAKDDHPLWITLTDDAGKGQLVFFGKSRSHAANKFRHDAEKATGHECIMIQLQLSQLLWAGEHLEKKNCNAFVYDRNLPTQVVGPLGPLLDQIRVLLATPPDTDSPEETGPGAS